MDAFIVHFGRSEKAETLQKIEAALAALHRAEENVDDDQQIAAVLEAIRDAAGTGRIGDGKIFVLDVAKAVRIRTGELDVQAI